MLRGFKALDRVLRGEATRLPALRDGNIDIPAGLLVVVLVILGMIAGACTGVFAVITRYHDDPANALMGWEQLLASTAKVPMLFCFTLVVTLVGKRPQSPTFADPYAVPPIRPKNIAQTRFGSCPTQKVWVEKFA